jgi:hypothetical protein
MTEPDGPIPEAVSVLLTLVAFAWALGMGFGLGPWKYREERPVDTHNRAPSVLGLLWLAVLRRFWPWGFKAWGYWRARAKRGGR